MERGKVQQQTDNESQSKSSSLFDVLLSCLWDLLRRRIDRFNNIGVCCGSAVVCLMRVDGIWRQSERDTTTNAWTHWELFLNAVGENHWSALFVFGQQARVLEVMNHCVFALDASVGDFANLVRVEFVPLLVVELLVELDD